MSDGSVSPDVKVGRVANFRTAVLAERLSVSKARKAVVGYKPELSFSEQDTKTKSKIGVIRRKMQDELNDQRQRPLVVGNIPGKGERHSIQGEAFHHATTLDLPDSND